MPLNLNLDLYCKNSNTEHVKKGSPMLSTFRHVEPGVVMEYGDHANIAASFCVGSKEHGLDLDKMQRQHPFSVVTQESFDGRMFVVTGGETSIRLVCFETEPGNQITVGLSKSLAMLGFIILMAPALITCRKSKAETTRTRIKRERLKAERKRNKRRKKKQNKGR